MFISHPHYYDEGEHLGLLDHLQTVRNRTLDLTTWTPIEQRWVGALAILHDFGKTTPQCQAALHPDRKYDGPEIETYHARIGAFATYHVLRVLDAPPAVALGGFLTIARHHGVIPDAAPYTYGVVTTETGDPENLDDDTPFDTSWVGAQVEAISENEEARAVADDLLNRASDGQTNWNDFQTAFTGGDLSTALTEQSTEYRAFQTRVAHGAVAPDTYEFTLKAYSALTLADTTHAADIDREKLDAEHLDRGALDTHVTHLQTDSDNTGLTAKLNREREVARQEVLGQVDALCAPNTPDVGLLTLPTGLGKTITGTSLAMAARDRLETDDGKPRIIYALPFTAIIEQTRELFVDDEVWQADPTGYAFTTHHYLSETLTFHDTEGDGVGPVLDVDIPDYAGYLGEAWRSGLTLTTFVQLFESLAGPTKARAAKLPALTNSVIVLDEPQALPKAWWPLIKRLFTILTEEFDATVICMTATQPTALYEDVETQALLDTDSVTGYYETARRVTYDIDDSVWKYSREGVPSPVTYSRAGDRIVTATTRGCRETQLPKSSTLAVCNTIRSASELTDHVISAAQATDQSTARIGALLDAELRAQPTASDDALTEAVLARLANEDPDLIVGTFSSRLRPIDRSRLLAIAERLVRTDQPFVFVSTQAIEAGVDISFARLFRDLAPLDSVVQAAGRCNRSFEWGEGGGDVTLWHLAPPPETGETPARLIYDSPTGHLFAAADALREACVGTANVPDATLAVDAVEAYYRKLADLLPSPDEDELVECLDTCRGDALRAASLIEDYDTVDVVVPVTASERQSVDEMEAAFCDGELGDGLNMLAKLANIRISVRTTAVEELATQPIILPDDEELAVEVEIARLGAYGLGDGGLV